MRGGKTRCCGWIGWNEDPIFAAPRPAKGSEQAARIGFFAKQACAPSFADRRRRRRVVSFAGFSCGRGIRLWVPHPSRFAAGGEGWGFSGDSVVGAGFSCGCPILRGSPQAAKGGDFRGIQLWVRDSVVGAPSFAVCRRRRRVGFFAGFSCGTRGRLRRRRAASQSLLPRSAS
jgi:hypothetical protein